MVIRDRRAVMAPADDHVVIYAALFLVCALLSALGGGWLGVACFVPVAIVMELALRWGERRERRGSSR